VGFFVTRTFGSASFGVTNSGGQDVPTPPPGYTWLIRSDGSYVIDANGNYVFVLIGS